MYEIKVEDYDEIYAPAVLVEEELAVTEDESVDFRNSLKYNYSFISKLHLSSEYTRDFYREIATFIRSYGLKVNTSWNKERIQVGKKTYAILSFKGLKLTVSFALNPADYEGTKYKFVDVSNVKKFSQVPAQMKITSNRKVTWVKELLLDMLKRDGVEDKALDITVAKIKPKTKTKLIKENLIKIN